MFNEEDERKGEETTHTGGWPRLLAPGGRKDTGLLVDELITAGIKNEEIIESFCREKKIGKRERYVRRGLQTLVIGRWDKIF